MKKKSKFIFFWLPYDVKYTYETFLTAFYLAIKKFPVEDSIHIGHKTIFADVPQHLPENWLSAYQVSLPKKQELDALEKIIWEENIFQPLEDSLSSKNLVWRELLTKVFTPLQEKFELCLEEQLTKYHVESIILWSNCPSIVKAAEKFNIPVIHNEMGPLRDPVYLPTCYFDFSGVNGNTESENRYRSLSDEQDAYPLLGRSALQSLFTKVVRPLRRHDEYDAGVPLQVEDDSNIIAFSNGFNNHELIAFVKSNYENWLLRKHPYGHLDYKDALKETNSLTPQEFIALCRKIVTINSSMGFEALLMGKPSQILGDSPFKFIDIHSPDFVKQLRFCLLNYLVPFEWMFNKDYYLWRLTKPSEKEIAEMHLKYYVKQKHNWTKENFDFTQLNIELENIYQRNLNLQFVESENYWLEKNKQLEFEIEQLKASTGTRIKKLSTENAKIKNELSASISQNEAYHHELWRHQHLLAETFNSKSWKITSPLRKLNLAFNKIYNNENVKGRGKIFLIKIARKAIAVPAIRKLAVKAAHKTGYYEKMRSLYLKTQPSGVQPIVQVSEPDTISRDTLTNLKKIKMLKAKRGNS